MDGTRCQIIDAPRGCLVLHPPTRRDKNRPRGENGSGGPAGPAAVSSTKGAPRGREMLAGAKARAGAGGKVWVAPARAGRGAAAAPRWPRVSTPGLAAQTNTTPGDGVDGLSELNGEPAAH